MWLDLVAERCAECSEICVYFTVSIRKSPAELKKLLSASSQVAIIELQKAFL